MNKSGLNQTKRALKDLRQNNLLDARNPTELSLIDESQSTTIEQDPITGYTYIKLLPNRRQEDSDKRQLKAFPGYRLIDTSTVNNNSNSNSNFNSNSNSNSNPYSNSNLNSNLNSNSNSMSSFSQTNIGGGSGMGSMQVNTSTVTGPESLLISTNLNEDVTEFLRMLNDIGSRISYFLDAEHANDFVTKDIVNDKSNTDSISSNIIKGMNELKSFFYEFGRKIAPNGVNPYCNDDCMLLKKKKIPQGVMRDTQTQTQTQTQTMDNQMYEKSPYNPHDLNTYMNCLDTLTRQSTVRDTTDNYNDFNLKVFQTIIGKVKTTKFVDSGIDELNVTRPLPFYNPLHLMLEILKIDTKLFNILYLLNLHNSFRSPITGVYYGKTRTKINENGYPMLSDVVTSTDIYSATVQTLDFLACILKLITFVDIDAYNKIIDENFSIESIGKVQPAVDGTIIVGDSASDNFQDGSSNKENIPSFLYGQLLSFCDAARQAISIIPLDAFPNSPYYNPAKVANIAYNTTYGLLAIAQMIEYLLKDRSFATIMSMLFPSGALCTGVEDFREVGVRNDYSRINEKDMQSITRMSVDGLPIDETKIVPPKSIPHYYPHDDPICINKATFCTIITTLCGISRFLWNSDSPCLRLCDLNEERGGYDMANMFSSATSRPGISTETINTGFTGDNTYTTTINPLDTNETIKNNGNVVRALRYDNNISNSNRAIREYTNGDQIIRDGNIPPEVENAPISQDLAFIGPMIKFLQENTYASVITENGKIFTFFQIYVEAFADYERSTYNNRVALNRQMARPPQVNRNLYSMLTRGMNFNY